VRVRLIDDEGLVNPWANSQSDDCSAGELVREKARADRAVCSEERRSANTVRHASGRRSREREAVISAMVLNLWPLTSRFESGFIPRVPGKLDLRGQVNAITAPSIVFRNRVVTPCYDINCFSITLLLNDELGTSALEWSHEMDRQSPPTHVGTWDHS